MYAQASSRSVAEGCSVRLMRAPTASRSVQCAAHARSRTPGERAKCAS